MLTVAVLAACGAGEEGDKVDPTVSPSATPTATNTATPKPEQTATTVPTATTFATDTPDITATPTLEPTDTPADLPKPTGTPTPSATDVPSPTSTPADPVIGPVFVDTTELLILESFPVQLELRVQGGLPTPCHQLVWDLDVGADAIRVHLFSVAEAGLDCIQVIEEFDERLPLGSFASGSFAVWLNDEQVGFVDLDANGGNAGETVPADLGQAAILGVGDTLQIGGTPVLLKFLRVSQDSRCPTDVACIWAGEAILVFSVEGTGAGNGQVAVRLSPGHGVTGLGDYMLTADNLLPMPKSDTPVGPNDYSVTLVVRAIAPATGSGIAGLVTIGPVCPVAREGVPCPDRPHAGTLVVTDLQGTERGRVTADIDGFYSLALSAGTYRIEPLGPANSPLPRADSVDVVVSNGWTIVHMAYDSGIR